ncbi:hypothetical protein ACM66B_006107 [Microbotryomycetes sp. NB124-2]
MRLGLSLTQPVPKFVQATIDSHKPQDPSLLSIAPALGPDSTRALHATLQKSDFDVEARQTLLSSINAALKQLFSSSGDLTHFDCSAEQLLADPCPLKAWTRTELERIHNHHSDTIVSDLLDRFYQSHGRQEPCPSRPSLLPDIGELSGDEDETAQDDDTALRAATLSITKRDEKMKWVFGDDYQKRSAPQAATKRKARPSSMSSFDSLSTSLSVGPSFGSSGRGPKTGIAIHRRVLSTSSQSSMTSQTPILQQQPERITHRRAQSVNTATGMGQPSTQQNPFSDLLPVGAKAKAKEGASREVAAPLTINVLSANSRRHLVRQSRKLEQVLGSVVTEDAVTSVLRQTDSPVRPLWMVRSRSFPPHSPTPSVNSFEQSSDAGDIEYGPARRMSRARSSPSPHSESPATSSPTDRWFPRNIPNATSFSALGGTLEMQKEERRRKLAKLQRMLGERVPVELALSDSPGRCSSEMSRGRGGLGNKLKGAFGIGRKHEATPPRQYQNESIVEVAIEGGPRLSAQKSTSAPVTSMTRARKLENVFGDLPPRSMLTPSSATSDRASTTSPRLRSSSMRTIDTYRSSVASLHLLAKSDPGTLEAIVDSYAADSLPRSRSAEQTINFDSSYSLDRRLAGGSEAAVEVDPLEFEVGLPQDSCHQDQLACPATPSSHDIPARKPINRASLKQTSKRATKISQLLGTTRGEVWNVLLDDLESAVQEEADLDLDEKLEILESVAKLRESTSSA